MIIEIKIYSFNQIGFLFRKWASVILLLLAINAFSLNLGYGSPIISRFWGIVFLIVTLLLYTDLITKSSDKRTCMIGISLVFISLVAILIFSIPEFWVAELPVFICGLYLILISSNTNENQLLAIALGCLFYAFFYIFYHHIPFLWVEVRFLSQTSTGIVGQLAGVPLSVGPTMSGALIFLTFVFCALGFFVLSEKTVKSLKVLLALLLSLTIAFVGYNLLIALGYVAVDKAMDMVYIAFILFLVPFILFIPKIKVTSITIGDPIQLPRYGAALIAIFLSVALISLVPYHSGGNLCKVVIYERDSEMGFDVPRFPNSNESFAPERGFSVGAIKLYLENNGYVVEEFNSTNNHTLKEALEDANIFIVMNLKKPFKSSDLESVKDFVKEGGGLLVFGEHTSMFAQDKDFLIGRDYLNEILEPTGIRINPDTADFITDHWTYGVSALPHFITKDLGFEIGTSSVGASLDITGEAGPLIIGRYAFSDKSNLTAPGHLGDRKYEKDEPLGDLVVAAYSTYGKGNVLAFGDTSYIFNAELPFRYKLVYDSVAWLRSSRLSYSGALAWLSYLLIIALILYISFKLPPLKFTVLFIASVAIIMSLSILVSGIINETLIATSQKSEKDIAWIDYSHLNQFDLENYHADGIAGLTTNLFRNGYLPMTIFSNSDFTAFSKGKVMIIIAPNDCYSSNEASILSKFVEGGGLLIISAGQKSANPLDPILKSFGMKIVDLPLGSPPWIVETHGTMGQGTVTPENLRKYWHRPKFMDAYPVQATGANNSLVWLNYRGDIYSLIISKRFGHGEVVLIGDSRFLLNENLEYLTLGPGMETKSQYQLQWMGNIELLQEILSRHKEGKL